MHFPDLSVLIFSNMDNKSTLYKVLLQFQLSHYLSGNSLIDGADIAKLDASTTVYSDVD
jgi:hypothetical protein